MVMVTELFSVLGLSIMSPNVVLSPQTLIAHEHPQKGSWLLIYHLPLQTWHKNHSSWTHKNLSGRQIPTLFVHMKGPALLSSRPVSSQFKVLTRRWHQLPVQQLTRVRTNSLKILPTKYKIRLPAKCAQVNCLISFKYELDRPSSLLPSAQIMWIRCAVPLPRPNKTWHQEGEGVATVQCVGHLTADSLGHAPTCELCPVF